MKSEIYITNQPGKGLSKMPVKRIYVHKGPETRWVCSVSAFPETYDTIHLKKTENRYLHVVLTGILTAGDSAFGKLSSTNPGYANT